MDEPKALCPSAQPHWRESRVIGIVGGTADNPEVTPFPVAKPVTAQLLSLTSPVHPTEVFRFAAPCMCGGCVHFKDERCGLVERIVEILPVVAEELPHCSIRPDCRWWRQEGAAACVRCPQVVTENHNPSVEMMVAAAPRQ